MSNRFRAGFRNSIAMYAGIAYSQVISFLGIIYISRALGVENYGIYTSVCAYISLFGIILLNGLNKVFAREASRTPEDVEIWFRRSLAFRESLIICALLLAVSLSFVIPYENAVRIYIIIYSTKLIFDGYSSIIFRIYQATEQHKYIAIVNSVNKTLFVGLSVAALSLGGGIIWLFAVFVVSGVISLVLNLLIINRLGEFRSFPKPTLHFSRIKPVFVFSAIQMLSFLALRIDLLMISYLSTPEQVGIYAVASKMVRQGLLIRRAISMAFFPTFVKKLEESKVRSISLIKYGILILSALTILVIPFAVYSKEIIATVFGMEYIRSHIILRILIFYVPIWAATLPITLAAQATGNERVLLIGYIVMSILNLSLNYLLFHLLGLMGIAISTLVVFSSGGAIMTLLCIRKMKAQGRIV